MTTTPFRGVDRSAYTITVSTRAVILRVATIDRAADARRTAAAAVNQDSDKLCLLFIEKNATGGSAGLTVAEIGRFLLSNFPASTAPTTR